MIEIDKDMFSSDIDVSLVQRWGSLNTVLNAARVSTGNDNNTQRNAANLGLNDSLIRQKHGVPYETIGFTFCIEAPIFVIRQLVKHRIASMNELSARYSELPIKFYLPEPDRELFQTGKPMEYKFHKASTEEEFNAQKEFIAHYMTSCETARVTYLTALKNGISKEIARTVLPVSTYTRVYFTINGRSLMNLLRLRTAKENASVPSHPQYEIQVMAEKMEKIFAETHPEIHTAWDKYGRESI